MSNLSSTIAPLPSWVPIAARHYIAHTEAGLPIRELARLADVHASTILRQVRRFETRRDDPLVDSALRRLAARCPKRQMANLQGQAALAMIGKSSFGGTAQNDEASTKLTQEMMRILRRLAELGAVLAMARDMDKGVIVREGRDGVPQRLAVVDRDTAEALALQEWMSCAEPEARVNRYHITGIGRSALKAHMASEENRAHGFSEAFADFDHKAKPANAPRPRINLVDSPLNGLARRRDRDGQPFLARELVVAGERLREDFELSQLANGPDKDWAEFLTGHAADHIAPEGTDPYARVATALVGLGPGLADVALRACCHLEGMETLEKRMGWSARSGKIVLRIALQRLARHYASVNGGRGAKIG